MINLISHVSVVAMLAMLGVAREADIAKDIESSPVNNFWERRHYRRDLEDIPVVSKNESNESFYD